MQTNRTAPDRCPPLDPALILWLNSVIPAASPRPTDTLAEIMFKAGQREVVNLLVGHYDRQAKDIEDIH